MRGNCGRCFNQLTMIPERSLINSMNLYLGPLRKNCRKALRRFLWSLDGNLRYIPMAALYDGKEYLVERFNHVVFTRVDKDRLTQPVDSKWTGYGFATTEASAC